MRFLSIGSNQKDEMFYAARQFSRGSSVTSQSSYYPESSDDIDDYEDSSEALDEAIRFSEITDAQSMTPTPNKRRSYHEYQQYQVHSGPFYRILKSSLKVPQKNLI